MCAFVLRRRLGLRPLLPAVAVPVLVLLPWLLWVGGHHVAAEQEGVLYTQTFHPATLGDRAGRLLPAAEQLAREAFDPEAWLIVLPLVVVVGLAAIFVRSLRAAAAFAAAVLGLIFAALLWAYWVGDTPTVQSLLAGSADRVITTGLVVAGLFLPILGAAFMRPSSPGSGDPSGRRPA
jgi:hypothetical protein